MAERPTDFISGEAQPTPEEQLLRLIETPEEKLPEAETRIEPGVRPKVGRGLLKGFVGYFSPGRFSLKVINRLLLGLAVVLSVYLALVILPIPGFGLPQGNFEERYNEEVVSMINPGDYRFRPLPIMPMDPIGLEASWGKRNVFIPVPKEPPPKLKEGEELIEVEELPEPVTVTTKEFNELVKKSLTLLATLDDPDKPSIKKAVVEDRSGNLFYLGKDDSIEISVPGSKRIQLKVKEISDYHIILQEDAKEKPLEAPLRIE